jgi:hypothetical protein
MHAHHDIALNKSYMHVGSLVWNVYICMYFGMYVYVWLLYFLYVCMCMCACCMFLVHILWLEFWLPTYVQQKICTRYVHIDAHAYKQIHASTNTTLHIHTHTHWFMCMYAVVLTKSTFAYMHHACTYIQQTDIWHAIHTRYRFVCICTYLTVSDLYLHSSIWCTCIWMYLFLCVQVCTVPGVCLEIR